jgi:hypothetical protein
MPGCLALSRLVRIGGIQAEELAIPYGARRGPYSVNTDSLYVDARRLKRMRRRHRARLRTDAVMRKNAAAVVLRIANRTPFLQALVKPKPLEEPKPQLPAALVDYPPARTWNAVTVLWWAQLTGGAFPGDFYTEVEIPPEDWKIIAADVLRTTGVTPWMTKGANGNRASVQFAGRKCVPAIPLYRPLMLSVEGDEAR